ncbi:MAG: hypothetical protein QF760_01465 [Candidatus Thalassarchaeaceae archaeon]|nr:hypothetical protein [Candidatus Thalassarchaeaceae archaeon]MDP6703180.1 hypothetical protein [Candidatus Thalassarchaeaceae archaeon]MDP7003825.1 hypothetical protein [Candidatus Thalassarchaeaceae archaeon]
MGSIGMATSPLDLEIRRIVTDSDLDGVVTAAILRRWWPGAEVIFGHPGELRAGLLDGQMDRNTAVCDLPRHPDCGLSIDHHQTNEPSEDDESGPVVVWRNTPSAARIAYELVSERVDLSDLDDLLMWVDKLDGGRVTREEYLSDHPAVWLGRVIDVGEGTAMRVLESLQGGEDIRKILSDSDIAPRVAERRDQRVALTQVILERVYVEDRLAIARLEDIGMRSNGYHVTALVGDACDACVIIHGNVGAVFGEERGYPVSASFYTNSFLHPDGGIYDLTRLATRFDPDGGGHANACGCRIQPLKDRRVEKRGVVDSDIEANLAAWLGIWAERRSQNGQQIEES